MSDGVQEDHTMSYLHWQHALVLNGSPRVLGGVSITMTTPKQ